MLFTHNHTASDHSAEWPRETRHSRPRSIRVRSSGVKGRGARCIASKSRLSQRGFMMPLAECTSTPCKYVNDLVCQHVSQKPWRYGRACRTQHAIVEQDDARAVKG